MNLFDKIWKKLRWRRNSSKTGTVSKRQIVRFLPKNPVIVDAGAHIGLDTLEMAKIWPLGSIYAFEPIPELFNELKKKTIDKKNIKCFNLALSSQTGYSTIHVSSGSSDGSSSLLPPKEHLIEHPTVKFSTSLKVPTTTLDDWAHNNNVSFVDFLWLDLQGMELPVLMASPVIVNTVRIIYTEVNLKQLYEGCALYPDLRSWLERIGFKIKYELLPWTDAGNVLFVR